ncbi:MAG: ABC transporter permease [Geminicoccaceae bacterium]
MIAYITRRLILALVTCWAISVVSFVIIQLPPGDFVNSYIANLSASGSMVSAAEADAMRAQYGLDRPVWVQYGKWMARVLQGDFGMSMEWGRPVTEVIGDRLWLTIVISIAAILLTWGIALPIGIYSAVRQYSIADYIFTFVGFVGLAVPNFLLALIIMYVGFKLFGMNIGGLFSPEYELAPGPGPGPGTSLIHLPLPALILALAGTAQLIRIMRANLLDELRRPYVTGQGARPAGMAGHHEISGAGGAQPVRQHHWLSPALRGLRQHRRLACPVSLPTVGPLLLRALVAQDMFLAGAIVLLLGVLTVIGTFLSDLMLMWIDPRIRSGLQA